MAKTERWDYDHGETAYLVRCPGCKSHHLFTVAFKDEAARQARIAINRRAHGDQPHQPAPTWSFNGSLDKPSFSPSMLAGNRGDGNRPASVCHSIVTNGKIQFLNDCTHELKGKTVSLPDL